MLSLAEGLFLLFLFIFLIKGFIRGGGKEWLGVLFYILALSLSGIFYLPISSSSFLQSKDESFISPIVFISLSFIIIMIGSSGSALFRRIREKEQKSPSLISRIAGGIGGLLQGGLFLVILTVFLEMQTIFSLESIFWIPNRFHEYILYWIPVF